MMQAPAPLLHPLDVAQLSAPTSETPPPLPVDLTPVSLPERSSRLQMLQTGALYNLPSRFFFSMTNETSVRLETNVFQTENRQRQDFVFREMPNITAGWALDQKTRISSNFFYFRDTYADHSHFLTRNTGSIGFRLDRDIPINNTTMLTASFFARELMVTHFQPLSDMLPQALITHRIGTKTVLYSSVIGQFRYRDVLARYQEIDEFYTIGGIYHTRPWTFVFDTTFLTNFGKKALRHGDNNQMFILTLDISRQIHPKLPIAAFVRAEPIFNMGANSSPGYAGFNFRLYGGIRVAFSKPAIFPVRLAGL